MRRVFGFVVAAALLAFVGAAMGPTALAQKDKDKAAKDKGAKDKGVKGGGATIEIQEGGDGKFRFFVRNADDKLLAMSSPGGYATEKDARAALDDLKDVIGKAKIHKTKKEPKKEKEKKKEKTEK